MSIYCTQLATRFPFIFPRIDSALSQCIYLWVLRNRHYQWYGTQAIKGRCVYPIHMEVIVDRFSESHTCSNFEIFVSDQRLLLEKYMESVGVRGWRWAFNSARSRARWGGVTLAEAKRDHCENQACCFRLLSSAVIVSCVTFYQPIPWATGGFIAA